MTIPDLIVVATGEIAVWLLNRGNRRSLPHRLARCGYAAVSNPKAKDGLWKYKGARQAIYVRANLPTSKQLEAAEAKARS